MESVGLDLDGTISSNPLFFSVLTGALSEAGWPIHIITYRDLVLLEETKRELKSYKIAYNFLHLPPEGSGPSWEWKAKIIEDYGITIVLEDSPENLSVLPESVLRLWVCGSNGMDVNRCINLLSRSETTD